MRTLGGREVLDLWDRAGGLAPGERAGVLVSAVDPALDGDTGNRLPLGQLNVALLALRDALAGPFLVATTGCPDCAETVELTVDTRVLLECAAQAAPVVPLDVAGWHVVWHPVTTADLRAAQQASSAPAAERALLTGVIESIKAPDGAGAALDDLPAAVRAALAAALSTADPLVEILVDLTCPECATAFTTEIDVAAFVWAELDARAKRLLLDIDTLARAYGWTEDAVLALSEHRRAAYLRVVREGTP